MDTIRSRRSNKKLWFFGVATVLALGLLILILCLTLSGEAERNVKDSSVQTEFIVTMKGDGEHAEGEIEISNVPRAFHFIDSMLHSAFEGTDLTKEKFYSDFKTLEKTVGEVLEKKAEEEAKKKVLATKKEESTTTEELDEEGKKTTKVVSQKHSTELLHPEKKEKKEGHSKPKVNSLHGSEFLTEDHFTG